MLLRNPWRHRNGPLEDETRWAPQTFVEWATQTINKSFWAGAFYRQQRDKGSSHQSSVRALPFKWLRIMYRCWQTRTPYDESTYLIALKKRGSPLLNQLGTQT
jgi:hypothetical protein